MVHASGVKMRWIAGLLLFAAALFVASRLALVWSGADTETAWRAVRESATAAGIALVGGAALLLAAQVLGKREGGGWGKSPRADEGPSEETWE